MKKEADSILREKLGHVELEWEIPNFLPLPHKIGEWLESPTFVMGDARWCLVMYPNGWSGVTTGSIGLFLQRKDGTGAQKISFYLATKANRSLITQITLETTFRKEQTSYGLRCAQRSVSSELEKDSSWDGALTVLFSARLLDGRNQDATSQTSRPDGVENLSSNWKELFLDGRDTDVKLKVQGREFNAHKLVLGARSRVFNAMLNNEMAEKNSGVVEIPDLDPESFQDFLLFVYTGKFDLLTPRNSLDLYKAADKYDLKDIKAECAMRMASWLTMDNIFDVVLLASTHQETDLLKHATEYFIKNVKEIFLTEKWKSFLVEQTPLANDLLIKMVNKP